MKEAPTGVIPPGLKGFCEVVRGGDFFKNPLPVAPLQVPYVVSFVSSSSPLARGDVYILAYKLNERLARRDLAGRLADSNRLPN